MRQEHGLATSQLTSSAVGGLTWLIGVIVLRPTLTDRGWAEAILMLAALCLFPLALRLATADQHTSDGRLARLITWLQLPAALLLGGAFLREPGPAATALALPWLATLSLTALLGLRRLLRHRQWLSARACVDVSLIYVLIGGAWAVLDRAAMRPLDFAPIIVLLTAVHFHYAGFVLPLVAGLAVRPSNPRLQGAVAVGVLSGIPIVAIGITATQLGLSPLFECLAALWLALTASAVGVLHLRLSSDTRWSRSVRVLWGSAGATLLASMGFAALYGSRSLLPPAWIAWLDIPTMQAIHGSGNSLGFALPALLGWCLVAQRQNAQTSVARRPA